MEIIYKNQSLRNYCDKNGLNYFSIKRSALYFNKQEYYFCLDKAIEHAINRSIIRRKISSIKEVLHNIDNFSLLKTSNLLGIQYSSLYRLINIGLSKKEAVIIIWFLGDKKFDKRISISKKTILNFLKTKLELKNVNDFMILLTFHYLGYKDAKNLIYEKRFSYLSHLTKKLVYFYKLDVSYIKDILQDLYLFEIGLYSNLVSNHLEQNIKYLNLRTRGKIINLINYYKENNIHLEDNINDSQNYHDIIFISGEIL